ncbi:MAG: NCS2 family permease [Duodenibacillus sp.]|nr:NCS2 family permease [Duodenibacillus sp.]
MERLFRLKDVDTTVRTELVAGLTTFMTMAYILAVNPSILGASGMDAGAVFTATAVSAFAGTLIMALLSNYPFALAPGMGLNAFFAFTVVLQMGYSWQLALAAVFVEGVIFIVLSLCNVREMIFNAIPMALKLGVAAGIGLFIAFIGLQGAKIVIDGPTLVSLTSFKALVKGGPVPATAVAPVLAFVGTFVTAAFMVHRVKGGILYGILITWILGMLCQACGVYVPDPKAGLFSLYPDFSHGVSVPSLAPTFLQFDFSQLMSVNFAVIVITFLFVDLFDTLGTLIGVSNKAGLLDAQGRLPRIKGALLADSIATVVGACLGTSTVTTYVESSAGVTAGGRTGLTALTAGLLFLASLLLAPVFLAIPAFATAPALIMVGFSMVSSILKVKFDDYTDAIPAYASMIMMPFSYSIADGIALGFITYVGLNMVSGPAGRAKLNPVVYTLAAVFCLKYLFV